MSPSAPDACGFSSIFELAAAACGPQGPPGECNVAPSSLAHQLLHGRSEDARAFHRMFRVTSGSARCRVSADLSAKYSMEQDNSQLVVSMTNRLTHQQAWFNAARTRKPQTFTAAPPNANPPASSSSVSTSAPASPSPVHDPTNGGATCDFCRWPVLTAQDSFGRIELPHAVTGSNLFKYGEPCHGLVLFKHHDPLAFTREQLHDFLAVSEGWFAASHREHPDAPHAFFLWNCLARAGASQFHGHGQLMLTRVPVPAQAVWEEAADRHAALLDSSQGSQREAGLHEGAEAGPVAERAPGGLLTGTDGGKPGGSSTSNSNSSTSSSRSLALALDLLRAHRAAGLLRCVACTSPGTAEGDGRSGRGPGGGDDKSGTVSVSCMASSHAAAAAAASASRAWVASSLAPIKDMELIVMGDALTSPAFVAALHAALRALIDVLGCTSFNVGIHNVDPRRCRDVQAGDACGAEAGSSPSGARAPELDATPAKGGPLQWDSALLMNPESSGSCGSGDGSAQGASGAATTSLPAAVSGPVIARVVCRGRAGQAGQASDFGCLEVLGRASIGHTDPYKVMRAFEDVIGGAT